MNIVINRSFGGFDLSYAGVMYYAKLKGIKLYAFTHRIKPERVTGKAPLLPLGGNLDPKHFVPYVSNAKSDYFSSIFYSKKPLTKRGTIRHRSYFAAGEIRRDDPDLVATVRHLGKKAGQACRLAIVRVPKGVRWHLVEYDGYEYVAENHRTWR